MSVCLTEYRVREAALPIPAGKGERKATASTIQMMSRRFETRACRGIALTQQRTLTLNAAFIANPQGFKHVAPKPPAVPTAAWINPPKMPAHHQYHTRLFTNLMTPGVSMF